MADFLWVPTYGAQKPVKPRVRRASFGDGYMQRVGDGINAVDYVWRLTFRDKASVISAIDAFLTARAGVANFTARLGADEARYVCGEWSVTEEAYGVSALTATFERVFEQ